MVLNGKGDHYGVSKKTQELVLKAVEQWGYTPNRFAKSLRTGKSHFAGLIISDISNPFYSTIARHVEALLFEKGYNLMVCCAEEDEDRERLMVETLLQQQAVDGLIVATAQRDVGFYDSGLVSRLPVVFIDRVVPGGAGHHVLTDNEGGAEQIVSHLLEEGNKQIVCMAITPLYLSTITHRINGYKKALKKAGYAKREEVVITIHYENIQAEIEQYLQGCLQRKIKPDAVFCLNNNIALNLLLCLRKKKFCRLSGIRVACFDDLEVFDLIDKKVTAVSQPVEEIGKQAATLLLKLIAGKGGEAGHTVLPTRLVRR